MIHNPCQMCGLPKVSTINPFCGSCNYSMKQGNKVGLGGSMFSWYKCKMCGNNKFDAANHLDVKNAPICSQCMSLMVPASCEKEELALKPVKKDKTKLTADQQIRAKALEFTMMWLQSLRQLDGDTDPWKRTKEFEDYIRDGRK